MELSIGIRLVIIFPTLLFLTGYVFKGIIEGKNREKLEKGLDNILKEMEKIAENFDQKHARESLVLLKEGIERWLERFSDFIFVFGIESIFIFIANGLIIIFELQQPELGVSSMIVGVVLSLFLLVGIQSKTDAGISAYFYGFILVFGLLGVELSYFISFGTENTIGWFIEFVYLVVFFICVKISMFLIRSVSPSIKGSNYKKFPL